MRLLLALLIALAALPARAQLAGPPVDVAIVLAVDVSESVDEGRYALQTEGIARAVTDPRVLAAIMGGAERSIALIVLEWSDRDRQVVTAGWTRIDSAESAAGFAARVRSTRRTSDGLTAIGDAMLAAQAALDRLPYKAHRRVIDVSGDGMANIGPRPGDVRDLLAAQGITVNGLAILTEEPWLELYYDQEVVGGPGGFVRSVENFEGFAEALANKLLAEIVALPGPPDDRSN